MTPYIACRLGRFVIGTVSLLAATTASGQQRAETLAHAHPVEELIVGDLYTVDVERGGMRRRFDGALVKANDAWIVLAHVSEGRAESGMWIPAKTPLFAKQFRVVRTGRQTEILWIPREAATIVGRVLPEAPSPALTVAEESPAAGERCRAVYTVNDKIIEQPAELAESNDDAIVIAFERRVAVTRAVPMLSELPYLGSAFRRVEMEHQSARETIARDNLLCVCSYEERDADPAPDPASEPAPERTAALPRNRK